MKMVKRAPFWFLLPFCKRLAVSTIVKTLCRVWRFNENDKASLVFFILLITSVSGFMYDNNFCVEFGDFVKLHSMQILQ